MNWEITKKTSLLKTIPFEVEAIDIFSHHTNASMRHPYYRLQSPDWVNILPITADNKAILIRQPRAGNFKSTLEVPGGAIDAEELRDPTMAAARELEEETGFTSNRILSLGSINPNPAIMTNRLHMFLGFNCIIPQQRQNFPDAEEQIEVELVELSELDSLVRMGRIDSCLSCLTIMLAARYFSQAK